jgi:hypothetical protein
MGQIENNTKELVPFVLVIIRVIYNQLVATKLEKNLIYK